MHAPGRNEESRDKVWAGLLEKLLARGPAEARIKGEPAAVMAQSGNIVFREELERQ